MSGVCKSVQCGKKRHAITMEMKVDIIQLESQRRENEISEDEQQIEPPKRFETKHMEECFELINKGLSGFEAQDVDTERFKKVKKAVYNAITCYKIIYENKKVAKVQTSLDQYFNKK